MADIDEKEFLVVGTWGNLFNWKEHESRMWNDVLPAASGGKITANAKPYTELGLSGYEVVKQMELGAYDAAHALGYSVIGTRFAAIAFGGACAGLGGAFLSLVIVPQWTDGMTAGRGWIALAIVVFASWKAWRVLLGAYLFGGISVLQLNLQAAGVAIPVELLSMSPYLITILVLVIISSSRGRASGQAPQSLGRSFHASG